MKVSDLAPERRFKLPYSGRTGVVVRHGDMGTVVRLDGQPRRVKGTSKRTGKSFDFVANGSRTEVISGGSEVEPL